MIEGYTEFLSNRRWDVLLHGTFEYEATVGTARRAANKLCAEFDPNTAFVATEQRPRWRSEHEGSNVHIHALLEFSPGEYFISDLEHWWEARWGFAMVDEYDPDVGAVEYATKYVAKGAGSERCFWDVYSSDRNPPT